MSLPMMMSTMQNICMPEPRLATRRIGYGGGLNTSPWTNFHPVSSSTSSCEVRRGGVRRGRSEESEERGICGGEREECGRGEEGEGRECRDEVRECGDEVRGVWR